MSAENVRAALDRLLAGRSLHTDGELTAQNLAKEAGVSRSTLYASYRELISDLAEHRTRLAQAQAPPAAGHLAALKRARDELAAAKRTAGSHRAERNALRSKVRQMANCLAAADDRIEELEEQLADARKGAVLVPLRRR